MNAQNPDAQTLATMKAQVWSMLQRLPGPAFGLIQSRYWCGGS